MDYVRSGFGIFGGSNASTAPSESQDGGAEIVERLVSRVTSATLVDDRRDALRGIKALSKKYRLEVGTQVLARNISLLLVFFATIFPILLNHPMIPFIASFPL